MICALLGAGTIGFGVAELADKTDGITIKKVLEKRNIPEIADRRTEDINEILSDESIDTVIELLGGVKPAGEWALSALRRGKNLVTANKLMLSEYLKELLEASRQGGGKLRFSAAVGGGIPFLFNLIRARRVDGINEVGGILNGTTNFILTSMADSGMGFSEALKSAQDKGYAEANPFMDVSGEDARCKIMLSACIAFDAIVNKSDILCKGIDDITATDMAQAARMGKAIKLIARAKKYPDAVSCSVEPTLVDISSVEAGIAGVENMAYLIGRNAGLQRFTGAGAGRYATAYAVVNDLMDIANGEPAYEFSVSARELNIDNELEKRRYLTRGMLIGGSSGADNGYYITPEVTAKQMHAAGKGQFFAAIY